MTNSPERTSSELNLEASNAGLYERRQTARRALDVTSPARREKKLDPEFSWAIGGIVAMVLKLAAVLWVGRM